MRKHRVILQDKVRFKNQNWPYVGTQRIHEQLNGC